MYVFTVTVPVAFPVVVPEGIAAPPATFKSAPTNNFPGVLVRLAVIVATVSGAPLVANDATAAVALGVAKPTLAFPCNEVIADAYFKAQMGLYKEGAIAEKEAHLVAIGTSAAVKCQYCIPYHISELKRLGATEDEIKTAVLIAADIMKMSTLFYGNEFDLEAFKKMLSGN